MKLFVKLLITALVLAVMLPFTVLKGTDGKPLMSLDNLKVPQLSLPKLPDSMKLSGVDSVSKREDIIYQWRDDAGELHFSTSPPADGIEYTAKGYDPNANLIQSIEIKHEEPEKVTPQPQSQTKTTAAIGSPYSPERIEKLFDDVHNVQNLLNDRIKQQEAQLGR